MILYQLWKNNNAKIKEAFGKFFARPVITETIGIAGLVDHMISHNTGFSAGQVKGILADMVKCIKELVLSGKAVKIDDLAIFTLGIINKEGAATKEEFSVSKNIESVKLRCRATGEVTRTKLNLDASLRDIEKLTKDSSTDGNPSGPSDSTDPSDNKDNKDNTEQGGGNAGGGSGSDTGGTGDAGGSGSSGNEYE